jgi:hypothetical protein
MKNNTLPIDVFHLTINCDSTLADDHKVWNETVPERVWRRHRPRSVISALTASTGSTSGMGNQYHQ